MARYRYKAVTKEGKSAKGAIEASSQNDATAKIKALGFYPVLVEIDKKRSFFKFKSAEESGQGGRISFWRRLLVQVKSREITVFTRQIATLLDAGLPLVKSLVILARQQKNKKFRNIIEAVGKNVEAGNSFSDALRQYPGIFPKLYVSTVKAGESAGILDIVLARLAIFQERNDRLRRRVKNALTYPVAVVIIALVILLSLVVFIVPKFVAMFEDFDIELPLPTVIVINISNFIIEKWYFAIILSVLIFGIYQYIQRYHIVRLRLDQFKLKFPVTGDLSLKYLVSRFARTLGTLISSGVSILQALEITKDTIDNIPIENAIKNTFDSVKEGETITVPLERSQIFPDMVTSMINVGEETGALDQMLVKVADTYEDEVDIAISSLTSLLEPALVIFIGAVVGGIVISMFLPLVKLMTELSV